MLRPVVVVIKGSRTLTSSQSDVSKLIVFNFKFILYKNNNIYIFFSVFLILLQKEKVLFYFHVNASIYVVPLYKMFQSIVC